MKPFQTQYGLRTKAEFTTENGTVIPIFADASDSTFLSISKGSSVELVHGAKGYSVGRVGGQWSNPMPSSIATGGAPLFPVPAPPAAAPQKKLNEAAEVAERIRRHVSTLAFCLRAVQSNSDFQTLSEEGQRQMAVTAFIQSQK